MYTYSTLKFYMQLREEEEAHALYFFEVTGRNLQKSVITDESTSERRRRAKKSWVRYFFNRFTDR